MDVLCGRSEQDDSSAITNLAAHFPAGTSVKDLDHYEQFIGREAFKRFDYGEQNVVHYGQKEAPKYDLEGFRLTTALFIGSKDTLAGPQDVGELRERLNKSRVVFAKAGWVPRRKRFHGFSCVISKIFDCFRRDRCASISAFWAA